MKRIFPLLILAFILFLSLSLLTGGCGGGGSGGSGPGGQVNIQVEYPQDKSCRQEESPTPTSTDSPIPPPDFIAFYLIDIQDPTTGQNLVETTRIDYPTASAVIDEIPVGPVRVVVAGFDQYNYLRTYGTSTAEILENQNTAVEVITTPVSPSPLPSPTITYSPTPTPSPTITHTPTPTPTATCTPTPSPTSTCSPSPSPTSTSTPTPYPTPSGGGVLYVGNKLGDKITVYNHASKNTLDIPPDRIIERSGGSPLNQPRDIEMDPTGSNLLYVADVGRLGTEDQIVVFDNANTADGSVSAFHTFYASAEKKEMNGAWGLYLDLDNDRLYVLNDNEGDKPFVLVFNNASQLDGEVYPDQVFVLDVSPPTMAKYIFVDTQTDPAHHIAYIADDFSSSIYAIDDINNQNPSDPYTYTPDRTIVAQTSGELAGCNGIFVHNNTIYTACCSNKSVTIIDNAASRDGATPSKAVLKGANTTFDHPMAVALDPLRDTLYVTDYSGVGNGRVLVFKGVSSLVGTVDQAPHYELSGAATRINAPYGLFVDIYRNQ